MQTDRLTDSQKYRLTDIQIDRHTDIRTFTDIQIDRSTDIRTFTDIRIDRHTDIQISNCKRLESPTKNYKHFIVCDFYFYSQKNISLNFTHVGFNENFQQSIHDLLTFNNLTLHLKLRMSLKRRSDC